MDADVNLWEPIEGETPIDPSGLKDPRREGMPPADPPAPTEEALTHAIPNGVPWPHVMMFHAGPANAHLIDGIVQ